MEPRVRLVAILASLALLLVVLELVRRRRLLERYALLWLFSALALLALAAFQPLLIEIAELIGIEYPPSALFLIAFGFVLVLLLHFSVAVSRLADQSKVLAQRDGDHGGTAQQGRASRCPSRSRRLPAEPPPSARSASGASRKASARTWTPVSCCRRSQATVLAMPSSTAMRDSQPSIRLAFSTDGQRRCTSTVKLGRCSSSNSSGSSPHCSQMMWAISLTRQLLRGGDVEVLVQAGRR